MALGGQLRQQVAHQIGHGPEEVVEPVIALHGEEVQAGAASDRQCHHLSHPSHHGVGADALDAGDSTRVGKGKGWP